MRIEGRSTEQISRALEVRPRTLYIWFSDPLVKQALAEQLERFNELFAERYAAACLSGTTSRSGFESWARFVSRYDPRIVERVRLRA